MALGWLLGGTVGLGTLMFALGIGPAVSVGFYTVKNFQKRNVSHDRLFEETSLELHERGMRLALKQAEEAGPE
ncbi:MAG: hypothetical protein CM1200mP40_12190 [Gammaproteobacteria bacterium]|nr:MAG: hypothetical protein CM1200mP40_12190 [Gammaproteobacteria bacterium]